MLEEYGYPYLSIDHLKMGLIRSGNTDLTPADDEELTEYLWPIVQEMVKTAIENGQSLIVEGCYIPPDWRSDFDGRYLQHIKFVCLAMSDAFIDAHYDEIASHACDIENRLDDSGCTRDSLKADNRRYIDSFAEHGEQVTVIRYDFEEETSALLHECDSRNTPSVIGLSRN